MAFPFTWLAASRQQPFEIAQPEPCPFLVVSKALMQCPRGICRTRRSHALASLRQRFEVSRPCLQHLGTALRQDDQARLPAAQGVQGALEWLAELVTLD